jgi:hypothetical protein
VEGHLRRQEVTTADSRHLALPLDGFNPRHPPPHQVGQEHPPDHQGDGAGGGFEDEEGAAGARARRPALRPAHGQHARRARPRVDESQHPFLAEREVKTRGILLLTTDKGLCGPLNANLFKLVTDIKTPAKFVAVGRKGAQFIARTKRDMLADFTVSDRVASTR